jgi:hypothetical protein
MSNDESKLREIKLHKSRLFELEAQLVEEVAFCRNVRVLARALSDVARWQWPEFIHRMDPKGTIYNELLNYDQQEQWKLLEIHLFKDFSGPDARERKNFVNDSFSAEPDIFRFLVEIARNLLDGMERFAKAHRTRFVYHPWEYRDDILDLVGLPNPARRAKIWPPSEREKEPDWDQVKWKEDYHDLLAKWKLLIDQDWERLKKCTALKADIDGLQSLLSETAAMDTKGDLSNLTPEEMRIGKCQVLIQKSFLHAAESLMNMQQKHLSGGV